MDVSDSGNISVEMQMETCRMKMTKYDGWEHQEGFDSFMPSSSQKQRAHCVEGVICCILSD